MLPFAKPLASTASYLFLVWTLDGRQYQEGQAGPTGMAQ